MSTKFSEYRKADGVFTSCIVTGMRSPAATDATAWLTGAFDHRTQRVDVSTGAIVDYVPPTDDDAPRQRRRAQALIAHLEQRQLRPMRELTIDRANIEAQQRLAAIDAEIAALRKIIN